jgi:excinuclease ABC subunit C
MNERPPSKNALDPETLRTGLPDGPGVYLFSDPAGRVIYVGKAKNLRKRVLSYFKPLRELPYKTGLMMNRAGGLDYILTETESEAFILESSLIKKHMPRYNVVLRDDKQYPSLRLDIKEPYPRLTIVRKIKRDGAVYFGPFSSAQALRRTLKLIDRIFQLRKCKGGGLPKRSRPCLNYQLDRCLGPCTRNVPGPLYREVVDQVKLFLEGRNRELIRQLGKNMERAADQLDFEKAARIRDQIRSVEKVVEGQHVVSSRLEDQDVIGLTRRDGAFLLVILFIRKGYLSGSRDYFFRHKGASQPEVLEAFLKQYYSRESFIPKQILVSHQVEDLQSITDWISGLAGNRVSIVRPRRGEKLHLLKMALANAETLLESRQGTRKEDLMAMAGSVLKLKRVPRVIEGLDISNIQGDMAVGAVAAFVDGLPHRPGYRNYRIKGVAGVDDYGMMMELVSRRLAGEEPPDLFVVDGGKGHLLAAGKVMGTFQGPKEIEAVAIAKGREPGEMDKVYLPGRKNPLPLRGDHPLLHLLMRIRDEAHRRAVTYHRKLRGKRLKTSRLDGIPGIGKKRKQSLLKHFGDIEAIRGATLEDLAGVPGISPSLAKDILSFLGEK